MYSNLFFYIFELLFFDGTVLTGKFRVGVPLNIQSLYLFKSILDSNIAKLGKNIQDFVFLLI